MKSDGMTVTAKRVVARFLQANGAEERQWLIEKLKGLAAKVGGHATLTGNTFKIKTPQSKYPEVSDIVFFVPSLTGGKWPTTPMWISNTDGVQGWAWHKMDPGDPGYPSNPIKWDMVFNMPQADRERTIDHLLDSIAKNLEHVRNAAGKQKGLIEVKGIKKRPDLTPQSRGWSTNPNFQTLTYYEVEGSLDASNLSHKAVEAWLHTHHKELLPGAGYGTSGTHTANRLYWDPKENAWMVENVFSYSGD